MTFQEYLISKKIDSVSFKNKEVDRWKLFNSEFDQMHPKSFTSQKLFLINQIRRAYPLTQVESATEKEELKNPQAPVKVKPKVMVKRPIVAGKSSGKPKMIKPVIKRPKKED